MKKIFSTLCMALVAVAMMGQNPVITFEKTEHDFGKINEGDGRVSTVFKFKNEGMSPLVLSNVRASCGCTTPTWTKEPIEPGQEGTITVTYNPNGRPGRFQKTVTITSNATEPTKKVYIKGEVIPKQAKPVNKFNVAVGELSMKTKTLDLGSIKKDQQGAGELEYANLKDASHEVALFIAPADNYLQAQATLANVKPNETGKFLFILDSKATKLYGPVEADVYVVIDGKKVQTPDYRLTIKANIEEDFSQMTKEEMMLAPKMETENGLELGTIQAGKAFKGRLNVKNVGVNPLQIRRVYSPSEEISIKPAGTVKSGKQGVINFTINTKGMEAGEYKRELTLISNDPEGSKRTVTLHFFVQ